MPVYDILALILLSLFLSGMALTGWAFYAFPVECNNFVKRVKRFFKK